MKRNRIIWAGLWHFRRNNFTIALGIAITTAVITGALLVGDSITRSLQQAVNYRLGEITHVLNGGERFFTDSLSCHIKKNTKLNGSPVLQLKASAQTGGGKLSVPKVEIYGVAPSFGTVSQGDSSSFNLKNNEVIISGNLAQQLEAEAGDYVLFHITKAGVIPANTPFVSAEDQVISRRFKVKAVADRERMSRFSLQNSQTAPFNAFVSLSYLNDLMELHGKANLMVFTLKDDEQEVLEQALSLSWDATDLNLKAAPFDSSGRWQVSSERVFIDPAVAQLIQEHYPRALPVTTYFVNRFAAGNRSTPYSFVSTTANGIHQGEVIINRWLADDLHASIGDTITFNYYTVGPLRTLNTDSAQFVVNTIIEMHDPVCNSSLMPDIPGLSNSGSCMEWETGVPVDLEAIRDKDEDYWNMYHGTPKAFIHPAAAEKMWKNRFGLFTSFIFDNKPLIDGKTLKTNALTNAGIIIQEVKSGGMQAAGNGVDFGGLFLALSFFIIVSGLLLTVLLFAFHLARREHENATLSSLGYTSGVIRRLLLWELAPVVFAGVIPGLLLGVGYNRLVFFALNDMWQDIVRTDVLVPVVTLKSLIIGGLSSAIVSWGTMVIYLHRSNMRMHQTTSNRKNLFTRLEPIACLAFLTAAVGIMLLQLLSDSQVSPLLFFLGGIMLLTSFMGFADTILRRIALRNNANLSFGKLVLGNLSRNKNRSLLVLFLLMAGAFLVVSTGGNKKDMFAGAEDHHSGTGGYQYYGETSRPVLENINSSDNFSFPGNVDIVQLRVHQGDDASCLNLNKISNPRIMGVNQQKLSGRFRFITFADKHTPEDPWTLLNGNDSTVIPAIADQTVIQWGLEKKPGDTLYYTNAYGDTVAVRLVAGLAASVFQGNIIISEKNFLKMFPYSSGTNAFLIHSENNTVSEGDILQQFKGYGLSLDVAAARLARFKSVENTYLSIFMALGALGLLLGTIGLAVILARTILERKEETVTLKSLGFSRSRIIKTYMAEYVILLVSGVVGGVTAAIIAVLPALAVAGSSTIILIIVITVLMIVNGFFWMLLISGWLIRE